MYAVHMFMWGVHMPHAYVPAVGRCRGVPQLLFTLVSVTGSLSKANRVLIQLPWLASKRQGPTFFHPL